MAFINKTALLVIFGLICVCSAATSGPSTYLTDSDKLAIQKLIVSSQKKDGSFLGLKNTHFAVDALKDLKQDTPQKSLVCDYAKEALKVVDAESIYYQANILKKLGCGQKANDKVKSALKSALTSSSMEDLHYAVLASSALLSDKNIDFSAADLKPALDKILSLNDEGLFKLEADQSGSLYATGLALDSLAALVPHLSNEKARIKTALKNSFSTVVSLASEGEDNSVEFTDVDSKTSSLKITSLVLRGLTGLADALNEQPKELTAQQISGIAEFLLKHKEIATIEDAYYLLEGLKVVGDNSFSIPVVVSVDQSSFSKDGTVKVRVSDVLGKNVETSKVSLTKAYLGTNANNALASNQDLAADKASGLYSFNLGALKPESGFYTLALKVAPKSSKHLAVDSVQRTVKVLGQGAVSDIQVTLSETKDPADSAAKKIKVDLKKPEKISATQLQHLFVEFQVKKQEKSVNVHQAFVRLSNDHEETVVIAKRRGAQGPYVAHVPLASLPQRLVSPNVQVEVMVGDAFLQTPVHSVVATLNFPSAAGQAAVDDHFTPKPVIEHKFRVPERRPPAAVSSAFTLAVLGVPAAVLAIGWLAVGANLRRFPIGAHSMTAFLFHGGLGLIFALYGLYWLRLTMFTTLIYLGVLLVPTVFFGRQLLTHLASTK